MSRGSPRTSSFSRPSPAEAAPGPGEGLSAFPCCRRFQRCHTSCLSQQTVACSCAVPRKPRGAHEARLRARLERNSETPRIRRTVPRQLGRLRDDIGLPDQRMRVASAAIKLRLRPENDHSTHLASPKTSRRARGFDHFGVVKVTAYPYRKPQRRSSSERTDATRSRATEHSSSRACCHRSSQTAPTTIIWSKPPRQQQPASCARGNAASAVPALAQLHARRGL